MSHKQRRIIGVLELTSKYRYGLTSRGVPLYLFTPYDDEEPVYIVGSSTKDLEQNMIALVEVDAPKGKTESSLHKPRGVLLRLLGPVGDFTAERTGLLHHYCPSLAWKQKEKTDQSTEPSHYETELDKLRIELSTTTGWTVFHIDPPGCRDIDDAMAWHPTRGWAITIADAAAAVPEYLTTDSQAYEIGSTFYDLQGKVLVPMLPETISAGSASLLPQQRRRGITYFTDTKEFAPSWITVAESYTYENFPAALYGVTKDSHDWIADQMILYNQAVGEKLQEMGHGILRVQQPADEEKIQKWSAICPGLQHFAMEAAEYVAVSEDREPGEPLQYFGHASLGLQYYCHASSPLRRYVDLMNQRLLKRLFLVPPGYPRRNTAEIIDHLNRRQKDNRRWTRDLTFLECVTPGKVHRLDIVWISSTEVWVPTWKRLLRLRHDVVSDSTPGTTGQITIFCDPTRRNWKRRILTAPSTAQDNHPVLEMAE